MNISNFDGNENNFTPLSLDQLQEILDLTIKKDNDNKIAAFLGQFSAYSGDSQFNIIFNAPSSTGKSYIATQVSKLFPREDVIEIGYSSPTAFFHDKSKYDEERDAYVVDLEGKVLIFLDQPRPDLLSRLRPLLSHDEKEIQIKITDKTQKSGMRTKTVWIKGFPSVTFCTAGLNIDEQEATRFLLLSPEISQEKSLQSVGLTVKKAGDDQAFAAGIESNPDRKNLMERIRVIKEKNVLSIKISPILQAEIESRFLGLNKVMLPRHLRDIKRLIDLTKTITLLNLWWRNYKDRILYVEQSDIDEAFSLWEKLSLSQNLNLPPYVFNLFIEVIVPGYTEKNNNSFDPIGVTRQEIIEKHFKVTGRMINTTVLRQQILPLLETTGLIRQEADQNDKRKILIFPNSQYIPQDKKTNTNNIEVKPEDINF